MAVVTWGGEGNTIGNVLCEKLNCKAALLFARGLRQENEDQRVGKDRRLTRSWSDTTTWIGRG
eukprot:407598-Hanusia_phi.AAC.1